VPQRINYQGKLTDATGKLLPDGTYGVVFKVWSTSTGTASNSLVWAAQPRDIDGFRTLTAALPWLA
jgi:hypothetical protein